MTGVKVALWAGGIVGGMATSFTGVILANVETISNATPVTLALTMGGITTAGVLGWKVSRAWSQMEARINSMDEHLKRIEEHLVFTDKRVDLLQPQESRREHR